MGNDLRTQIYNNLKLIETEDLVEIWSENDRVEYSDTAFEVIHEILLERLGEVPPQGEPIEQKDEENNKDEKGPSEGSETTEEEPVFYYPKKVIALETWINRAANACIIVFIFQFFNNITNFQKTSIVNFLSGGISDLAYWLIGFVFAAGYVAVQVLIIYLPLKALGKILKILMEMEFNSRGVKQ